MLFVLMALLWFFMAITNTGQPPLHVDVNCATKTQAVSWALISVHVVGDSGNAHVLVKCAQCVWQGQMQVTWPLQREKASGARVAQVGGKFLSALAPKQRQRGEPWPLPPTTQSITEVSVHLNQHLHVRLASSSMPDAHPVPVMCGIVIHATASFHLQTSRSRLSCLPLTRGWKRTSC